MIYTKQNYSAMNKSFTITYKHTMYFYTSWFQKSRVMYIKIDLKNANLNFQFNKNNKELICGDYYFFLKKIFLQRT